MQAGTLAAFAEFVQQRFGPRLLSVLPQLQNGTGANFEFPQLPGSHLSMDSPALELVKQVVQVLQLDRELASAAHTIRKNALTLLGVGEFAAAAAFVNPCLSYRLSEVICTYCCFCRDVDLCRDKHLVIEAPADGAPAAQAAAPAARWLCPLCKNEYDRAAIEQQLVASFSKRVAQYQLQDLKCVRCRMVKPDNLAEFCVCSGRFVNAQSSPADFATLYALSEFCLCVLTKCIAPRHLETLRRTTPCRCSCTSSSGSRGGECRISCHNHFVSIDDH